MMSWRSATEIATPRRTALRVRAEKTFSSALRHETEVGGNGTPNADDRRATPDLRALVGGVAAEDGVNDLDGQLGPFDGVEELDELLVPVLRHATADDGTTEDVERGEQGGRAIAFVVVRHGCASTTCSNRAGGGAQA